MSVEQMADHEHSDLGGVGLPLAGPTALFGAADASNGRSRLSGARLRIELVDLLKDELHRDDLSSEDRIQILDRLERIEANEDSKDTENKRWLAGQTDKLVVMVIAVALAQCAGKFASTR